MALHINFQLIEDVLFVHLEGEVDHHVADSLRKAWRDEMFGRSCFNIVLDFTHVQFMDSSGIGVILGRYKEIIGRDGLIAVYGMNETIQTIFYMAGLSKIIKVTDSKEEALSFMGVDVHAK